MLRSVSTSRSVSAPAVAPRAAAAILLEDDLPGVEEEQGTDAYGPERTYTDEVSRPVKVVGVDPARGVGGMSVEIEVVMLGALMKVRAEGVTPFGLLEQLKQMDPAAKFRTEFPSKGFGGGGGRDLKLARVLVIGVRVTDGGKFLDLTCQGDGDEFSVRVGKNSADGFPAAVAALGKVSERNLLKIEKAYAEKGNATVVLGEAEQFGVKYSTMGDGAKFSAEFVADAPAVAV